MARGVRKTPLERLHEELAEVQNAIEQYSNSLATMKERERSLRKQIELEELKSIREMMETNGLTLDGLKDLIESATAIGQGA